MTMTTRLKKTNLRFPRILRHIGSRELPRRSGYYKHTWYGAILEVRHFGFLFCREGM